MLPPHTLISGFMLAGLCCWRFQQSIRFGYFVFPDDCCKSTPYFHIASSRFSQIHWRKFNKHRSQSALKQGCVKHVFPCWRQHRIQKKVQYTILSQTFSMYDCPCLKSTQIDLWCDIKVNIVAIYCLNTFMNTIRRIIEVHFGKSERYLLLSSAVGR